MLRSGNISNYRQILKYVTFNQGVVGSSPTALTKSKQRLSIDFRPLMLPGKCDWEAHGKQEAAAPAEGKLKGESRQRLRRPTSFAHDPHR
jgi:hypothetical protein